jgi:magnesium chelatase family protein
VPAVPFIELADRDPGEPSANVKSRVQDAKQVQLNRYEDAPIFANSQMESNDLKKYCQLSKEAGGLLKTAMDKLGLSARAYDRILKVSRTIADLSHTKDIDATHLSEAIQYRSLDRQLWLG